MTNANPALDAGAIGALRAAVAGDVVAPGDAAYDQARAAWNLTVNQHPALVIMAANAGDVAAGVRFARDHGLEVALQATGHGLIRPADGALLINTAAMTGVTIDPAARTAWIEAGTMWGDVLPAAQAHGLAPLLGSSPGVGAIAYTLGGGYGWLGRKYGLAADSARRFAVVTADGEQRTASADENPELFWGLRGAGTALAAVTGMEVELYPVETVYGGFMVYPAPLAGPILRRWRDWTQDLPDEMSSAVKIINVPDMDTAPPPLRGQTVVLLEGCYCGDVDAGAALMQSWRDWQAPLMDAFRPMPFSDVAQISQDPVDPMPSVSSGAWLSQLDDATIDALARYATLQEGPAPLIFGEVRHMGGAVARADASATAFGYRDRPYVLSLVGLAPAPPLWDALQGYLGRLRAEIAPALAGVYLNFLEGQEAADRVRDGFPPETFARLAALKAQVDPDNLFSRGMAIPVGDGAPAAQS